MFEFTSEAINTIKAEGLTLLGVVVGWALSELSDWLNR